MNFGKPTTKELIRDIGSMRETALTLMNQEKSYDPLLSGMLRTDYYNDEDIPWPNLDYLKSATGWSYDKIRKELAKIYEDLKVGYANGICFKIYKTEYLFFIKAYNRYLDLQFEDIVHIPRVGETIHISYFESYVGNDFHVERIQHNFRGTTHEVVVWLKNGEYNIFEAFEKDKEYSEGWIDTMEYYGLK